MRKIAVIVAISALTAVSARAEDHTVSWYMNHPSELRSQLAYCADDPGHGRRSANCINASQARWNLTASREQAMFNGMVDDTNRQQEQQWHTNPTALLTELRACNMAKTEAVRQIMRCDRAFSVAQQITGSH